MGFSRVYHYHFFRRLLVYANLPSCFWNCSGRSKNITHVYVGG